MGSQHRPKGKNKYWDSGIEYKGSGITGISGKVSEGLNITYTPTFFGKPSSREVTRKMSDKEIARYKWQVDQAEAKRKRQAKQAEAQRKKEAELAPLREAEAAAAAQREALERARAEAEKARQHSEAMQNQAKAQAAVSEMTQEGGSNKPHITSEVSSSSVDGTSVEKRRARPRNKLTAYLGV